MPRYFFDVLDGLHVADELGRDLPDLDAAKREGMRIASGFASNSQMIAEDGGALVITVRDSPDRVVLTVRLNFNIESA